MNRRNRREFLLEAGLAAGATLAADPMKLAASSLAKHGSVPFATESFSTLPAKENSVETKAAAPPRTIRGLMVDAGRVPETIGYYKRVIDFCAAWELNTLQFRLTDDQGCAMRFISVPDLVTHRNAFTADELKGLVEYGNSHSVDLIPEIESFGHTGFITRSPRYSHLLDQEASGSTEFTGIIPVNPESLQLMEKLYREIAAIFPSVYLHGGCDEVNWGGSTLSRNALQSRTRAQIWAEYLNSLNEISSGLGKQFIVWGDFVLHKEPQILARLNKSIIIMDWNYSENNSAEVRESLQKISAHGSRAIGAPGLINYKWGARAGSEQLRNIDAFADAYLQNPDKRSLGIVLTNWIPSRYLQNSIWDGFAYAAVAFNAGTAAAQTSAFRRFVEKHYDAVWNETWEEAFELVYDVAPSIENKETASWMRPTLPVPWSTDEQLIALVKRRKPQRNPFPRVRGLLIELETLVLKNFADFRSFQLSLEYLDRLFWREAIVSLQACNQPPTTEDADTLIQSIAERDRDLATYLAQDWNSGRFPDAPVRTEAVFGLEPKDQLLFQWGQATAYTSSLARQPGRFHSLLQQAAAAQ